MQALPFLKKLHGYVTAILRVRTQHPHNTTLLIDFLAILSTEAFRPLNCIHLPLTVRWALNPRILRFQTRRQCEFPNAANDTVVVATLRRAIAIIMPHVALASHE